MHNFRINLILILADSPALPRYIVDSLEAVCSFPFITSAINCCRHIYPWLRNRCLAINNSSLLVSADESCTRCLATVRLEHTYFLRYFGPLGRLRHFSLLFLILIQSVKEGHETIPFTERYIHTYTFIYVD
jgi:hypothetical protein